MRPTADGKAPEAPDGFTVVVKENGLMILRKKRYRDLKKVGIGGFQAKTRNPNRKGGKDDPNGDSDDKPTKKRAAWKPKKNKILLQYPEYIQDSFFGRSFIDACPLETDPEDMLAASEVVKVRSKDDDFCGLQLSKEALAALEEVKVQEEKERRQKEELAEKARLKVLKEQEAAEEAKKEAEKSKMEERLRIEDALSALSTSKDSTKDEKKTLEDKNDKVDEDDDEKMEITDELLQGDEDLLLGPDLFGDDILSMMNVEEGGGLDEMVSEEKEGEELDAKDMEDIFNDMIDEEEKKEAQETKTEVKDVQIKTEPQQTSAHQGQPQQQIEKPVDQIKVEQQQHDQQHHQRQQQQQQQMMSGVVPQQHHPNMMSPAVPVSSPMPSIQTNIMMMQQPVMQQQQQPPQQQMIAISSVPHMPEQQQHMIQQQQQQHQPMQMMQTIMVQQPQQPQQIHLIQQQQQQQQLMIQRQQQMQRQQLIQQQQQHGQPQQIQIMGNPTMVRPQMVIQDQRPMMQSQPTEQQRPQMAPQQQPMQPQQILRPLPPGAALPAGQQFNPQVMGVRTVVPQSPQQQVSFPPQPQPQQAQQIYQHPQQQQQQQFPPQVQQQPQPQQQQQQQQQQPSFVQSGTWTPSSPTGPVATAPTGAVVMPQTPQPGPVPTPPSDGRPASPEKAPTPTDVGGSASQRSQLLKWESDEPLGSQATIAMILYANQNHPNLKTDHPSWTDRIKQIAKIWKNLPNEKRQPYVQQARENRTANRVGKQVRTHFRFQFLFQHHVLLFSIYLRLTFIYLDVVVAYLFLENFLTILLLTKIIF